MRTRINLDNWNRKDHFLFFKQFEEPFFGVTLEADCTRAYARAKQQGGSFFLFYLYAALKAANETEPFRYRIHGEDVYSYDVVHASPTINRPDGTFGFAYLDYNPDEMLFYRQAQPVLETVRQSKGLVPAVSGENVIHFSALPWLNFTALSHARCFHFPDSCPKISFGKLAGPQGEKRMPVSVHVHHGLMDGYHVGQFADRFQQLLDEA
ncbi:chloramphenicol acetyltransferase [Niabella beijingensis]|uniref:chloramphenicol acetyltransferase n=1 Tax=Niabella beijingensis TaxID=2872700 RepID=UPI001CBDDA6E|nr:chloramphenicol acetyltransferase [Niabella beijingensis]MBZ4190324.1 chloramphenicol acetyltransferase [Niabella beijingensis]